MYKLTFVAIAALAAVTVLLHSVSCQAANVEQLENLKNQYLPEEYKNTNWTLDDAKRIIVEKCKKASGGVEDATVFEEIEKGATTLMSCLSPITNWTAINEEMEKAIPEGELDTVFEKYCTKMPDAQRCLRDFNSKLLPCLTNKEKEQNAIIMRVITSLMGLMCEKDGDLLTLFVAEEGPECLESKKDAIGQCAKSVFSEVLPKNGTMPNLFDLPELIFDPKHCLDLERFEVCIVHHLEKCREITPANIVESAFRFIKKTTSCKSIIDAAAKKSHK